MWPAASVTSGSRAATQAEPGITERSSTITVEPTLGWPFSSRRVATVAIRRLNLILRRRVPSSMIFAWLDALVPLLGGPRYGPPVPASRGDKIPVDVVVVELLVVTVVED